MKYSKMKCEGDSELRHPLRPVRKTSTVTAPDLREVLRAQDDAVQVSRFSDSVDSIATPTGLTSRRRSEIPDAILIFRAVESQNKNSLKALLDSRPELANCHGGAFHVTPLHVAIEKNWHDGAQKLLGSTASAISRNQYGQTPLHYAAAMGRTAILSAMLAGVNPLMIDTHDLRGITALHDAATAGCLKSVEELIKYGANASAVDCSGQTPLHKASKIGAVDCCAVLMKAGADLLKKDDRGITSLRYLREYPESLEVLLDAGIITSPNRSSGFPLTFDFRLLVAPYGIQQSTLLANFAKSDYTYLLAHPLCHILLILKWRKARIIFFAYLLFFLLFAGLTYAFMFDRFIWSNCKAAWNETLAGGANSRSKIENKNECETIDDVLAVKITLLVQMSVLLLIEINHFRTNALVCVKSLTWWLIIIIIAACLVIIVESWLRPTKPAKWEHHLATLIILLQGTQILHLMSKFPSLGIYWLMFIRVSKMFLRVFFIYICLLFTFTMTFYLALANKSDSNAQFGNVFFVFLKSLTMMVGELDLNDMQESLRRLPVTSHLLVAMFILLISIILANLLVALAVSDVNGLRSIAHLMRLANMVEAIVAVEQLWDCPAVKYLAHLCYLGTQDTQFRLWPRTDQRHPKVIVNQTEFTAKKKYAYGEMKNPRWIPNLMEKLRSKQYSVEISTCILENILDRMDVKEGNGDSRLSVKFRCVGSTARGAGRKISAAEMISRRRHTVCKNKPLQRSAFSRRVKAASRKKRKIQDSLEQEPFV